MKTPDELTQEMLVAEANRDRAIGRALYWLNKAHRERARLKRLKRKFHEACDREEQEQARKREERRRRRDLNKNGEDYGPLPPEVRDAPDEL